MVLRWCREVAWSRHGSGSRAAKKQPAGTSGTCRVVGDCHRGREACSAGSGPLPRPASPITELFELSPATLVGQYRVVPRLVVWRLGRFNRYGRVAIAPDRVGFDHKMVRWNRVIEVRTCQVTGRLPLAVLNHEATRISKHLPRFPGREKVGGVGVGPRRTDSSCPPPATSAARARPPQCCPMRSSTVRDSADRHRCAPGCSPPLR